MYKRLFTVFLCVFSLLAGLAVQNGPALAQGFGASEKITEEEKAVFAYFQMEDLEPNFKKWIKESRRYQDARTPKQKQAVFEKELLRLKWGYSNFSHAHNFITLTTNALVRVKKTPSGPVLNIKFKDIPQEEGHYLPYAYGLQWIAFVINDLIGFAAVPLNEKEYQELGSYFSDNQVHMVDVNVQLKPIEANHTEPAMFDGIAQWVMKGEVASLELLYGAPETREKLILWQYKSPWYLENPEKILPPENDLIP